MALAGLTFNFYDLHASEKATLSKLITKHNGTVSYIFGKTVTHLVTTPQAIQENGYKLQRCKKDNIKPVTEKWIRSKISNYTPPQNEVKKESSNSEKKQKNNNQLSLQFSPPKEEIPVPSVSLVLPNSVVHTGQFTVF